MGHEARAGDPGNEGDAPLEPFVPDAELEPLAPEPGPEGSSPPRVARRSAAPEARKGAAGGKKRRQTLGLYQRYPALYRVSAVIGFALLLLGIAVAVIWSRRAGRSPLEVAMIALAFGGVCGVVGKFLPALVVYLGLATAWLLLCALSLSLAFAAFLAVCAGMDAIGF